MVMMEEPQPEVETLTLGFVELIIEDLSLTDIGENSATTITNLRSIQINEQFDKLISARSGFSTSGYDVALKSISLEFDSVSDGSVISRLNIIGFVVITAYQTIATYPDFKSGLSEIAKDLEQIIEFVIEKTPKPIEDLPDFNKSRLYLRDEDEILSEIIIKKQAKIF